MKPTIAVFNNDPECSSECINGMRTALGAEYKFIVFKRKQPFSSFLDDASIVAFPGGIGDADSYDRFFTEENVWSLKKFLDRGGKYLGICMGAYWAGKHYFNLIGDVDAVQYIKRPDAEIKRSYSTIADVTWNGQSEKMFFYDGCSLLNANKKDVIATYANGDPMAIIKGKVGIIGCHPESEQFWYDKPYLNKYWHEGRHHNLLLDFVNDLMRRK